MKDFFDWTTLTDPPLIEDHNIVGKGKCLDFIVGGEYRGDPKLDQRMSNLAP